MPHTNLRLLPGVDTTKTPALNEAAVSSSNLIRFLPDSGGNSYAQKLGGWTAYYNSPMPSTVRALKAWEDLNTNLYLGVGCEDGLYAIRNGTYFSNISPRIGLHTSVPLNLTYGAGVTAITVNDTASNANVYSFVYFDTPIAVGGTKLFGAYTIDAVNNANQYVVNAEVPTTYASPQTATITIASPAVITVASTPASGTTVVFSTTGTLPGGITAGTTYFVQYVSPTTFHIATTPTGTPINTSGTQSGVHSASFPGQTAYISTTNGTSLVNVLFPNHGLSVASSVGITVPLTVGGITLSGLYTVNSVIDANNFTFIATNTATSTASAFENSDTAYLIYYYSVAPANPPTAYGTGPYSGGAYGGTIIPITTAPGVNITAEDWTLDNWGNVLISCPFDGPIFAWIPQYIIQNSFYLDNAPLINAGIFVAMPQRQVVAWGSTFTGVQDPLLIRWSDVEDYNVWDANTNNQAGSYRIPTGSRIIGALQAMQQGLIWTDIDVYAMQYVGFPYVYSFNKVGSNCGLIARKAANQLGNNVYWMSQKQFFKMTAGGVEPMICPVWDIVFQNLDTNNKDKIRCAANTQFNEIFWFYPSITGGTGEVDSYVKYNVLLDVWDFGSLGRTAWIDQSQLGAPIGAGLDKMLYQHETSNSANGSPMAASITTGYFSLQDADKMVFIDQVWPDMKWGQYSQPNNATVYMTINSVNYPGDIPIVYGPYPMTQGVQYLSVRVRGRLFSFTLYSNDADSFWRLGNIRFRVAPDGKF